MLPPDEERFNVPAAHPGEPLDAVADGTAFTVADVVADAVHPADEVTVNV